MILNPYRFLLLWDTCLAIIESLRVTSRMPFRRDSTWHSWKSWRKLALVAGWWCQVPAARSASAGMCCSSAITHRCLHLQQLPGLPGPAEGGGRGQAYDLINTPRGAPCGWQSNNKGNRQRNKKLEPDPACLRDARLARTKQQLRCSECIYPPISCTPLPAD